MANEHMTDEQWTQLREATAKCSADLRALLDVWSAAAMQMSQAYQARMRELGKALNDSLAQQDIKPIRFRDRQ